MTFPSNQAESQKEWLSPHELFIEHGFSESWQAKARMNRIIPFSKIGGKFVRYSRTEINRWLENHQVVSA